MAAANKASPFETPLESKKFLKADLSLSSHDGAVSGGMIYQGAFDEYLSPQIESQLMTRLGTGGYQGKTAENDQIED